MTTEKRRINIMSSCDDDYAKFISVQLLSIADNLLYSATDYEVHFYLFHSGVSKESVEYLRSYSDTLGIAFYEARIIDTEPYMELASKGGNWPPEAYYSLVCHRYLPPEADRVLYIDAADVLILGDIGEFYFTDFEGCSIAATCAQYKKTAAGYVTALKSNDLHDEYLRFMIIRGSIFNSGSYLINLDKMRRENISLNEYIALKNSLENIYPNIEKIYHGDEGLLAAAFVGDIKYFGYPEIKDVRYQPYNFCLSFFDREAEIRGGNPWYVPRILHFAGGMKPWLLTSENEKELKPGQWPFYKIYRLYASQVPSAGLK
ncbi:MAG: hypothetical protein LBB40_05165 [Holophagales bacterium]|jgi:lipopolysaccharide biosynthesis glycosyltransferase|nr:hypothetical protein [Holophagales bacterium]